MKQSALRFILYAFLVAAVCAILQFAFNQWVPEHLQLKSGYLLLGVFVAIVIGVHLLLLKSAQGSPQGFIRIFMATTALKLMAYMAVLIVFFLFSTENKKVLALYFLFYYFVFTSFEVGMLYSDLRKMK